MWVGGRGRVTQGGLTAGQVADQRLPPGRDSHAFQSAHDGLDGAWVGGPQDGGQIREVPAEGQAARTSGMAVSASNTVDECSRDAVSTTSHTGSR